MVKIKYIVLLLAIALLAGCRVSARFLEPGVFQTEPDGRVEKKLPNDPEKRPGFRRTIVGHFADAGFGLVSFPFFYVCTFPAMMVVPDPDFGQAVVYPFGFIGAVAFASPVVILKFVFYDLPDGVGWLFTTGKGKVDYYIRNIDDLSESEYLHLIDLTAHDFGDVARHKNMLYSWGKANKAACRRWKEWWKKNRRFTLEEIRKKGKADSRKELRRKKDSPAERDDNKDDYFKDTPDYE